MYIYIYIIYKSILKNRQAFQKRVKIIRHAHKN